MRLRLMKFLNIATILASWEILIECYLLLMLLTTRIEKCLLLK